MAVLTDIQKNNITQDIVEMLIKYGHVDNYILTSNSQKDLSTIVEAIVIAFDREDTGTGYLSRNIIIPSKVKGTEFQPDYSLLYWTCVYYIISYYLLAKAFEKLEELKKSNTTINLHYYPAISDYLYNGKLIKPDLWDYFSIRMEDANTGADEYYYITIQSFDKNYANKDFIKNAEYWYYKHNHNSAFISFKILYYDYDTKQKISTEVYAKDLWTFIENIIYEWGERHGK